MARLDGSIAGAIEASRRALVGSSPTPALDARVLTGSVLGLDASALIAYGENVIGDAHMRRLAALVERRKKGEPVAYIVGSKEFCGLRIAVDRRVLIPRPETEDLVARVIDDQRERAVSILDLGTGSGAVACALARGIPAARILAVDVSADALAVATSNIAALGLSDQIETACGDLFGAVPSGAQFDAIVANLPYVGERDVDILEAGVRDFEPATALFGGVDGLDVYRRMLPEAPAFLHDDGALYMECGPRNALELAALAQRAFPAASIEVIADLGGRERLVVVR